MRVSAPLNSEALPSLQWIEVASSLQIPSFQIIGLPSPEVAESRERIRAAIQACGFEFPRRRVVVNLSPASVRKRGTGSDLAMALAVLGSSRKNEPRNESFTAWGELGLDGSVKSVGQLTRALYAAWREKVGLMILSSRDLEGARQAIEILAAASPFDHPLPRLYPVSTLEEAWEVASGRDGEIQDLSREANLESPPSLPVPPKPMQLLDLPESLERALTIAVSGAHHLLLLGPRGTGKSHALEWFVSLQPTVSPEVRLMNALLSEIHSSNASANAPEASWNAPVRRVGLNVRPAALTGGANELMIRPGEFSLAHGGVLIADEFPEWPRDARESLREPLERRKITLTRASGTIELPAAFTLAGNGNLCPCGGWPPQLPLPIEASRGGRKPPKCKCGAAARISYLARFSGPILDRVDIIQMITTPPLVHSSPQKDPFEHFVLLRSRVSAARRRACERWGAAPGHFTAEKTEELIQQNAHWKESLERLSIGTLRSRHKIVRLALTIALWEGRDEPTTANFAEASLYRPERFGFCD